MKSKYRDKLRSAIDRYWRVYYRPPSLRYLCVAVGSGSTSLIKRTLDGFVEEGYLVRTGRKGQARQYVPRWVKDKIDG